MSISLAGAPLRFLAKITIALARDLADAIGRLTHKSDLWTLRLLLALTPVAIHLRFRSTSSWSSIGPFTAT